MASEHHNFDAGSCPYGACGHCDDHWTCRPGDVALHTPRFRRAARATQLGLLSYAISSWLAVALALVWTTRQTLRSDVFRFRRLTLPAIAASLIGFGIVTAGVPIVTHWLASVTGHRSQDVRIDFHDAKAIAIVVFLFVVTTPVTEEILYRGLLVSWLRRIGWQDSNILAFGTVIFAANHIIPLGLVWAAAMILLGLVTYALRLRYESLSPAWLVHALFNAQLTLSYPLMAWFAQAA
ncbi:CPBP family intramembrane glutamic endopeptidase [Bradyrhizobium diversitatis]|uniref:CPBP family intramembrane metalloprotease n=1 Tax=Bradyrhizobium diversitatis TaxID=2755406 RepID=A0ABS0P8B4_9BRAD|nr:CPBP family intramembrane glutamic endopeptidase [Bradyrhizobium diversitatis]MBH5389511.1 CPBP family intramembrane metalloprotease [Bradyrhizobium diversitatis]